MSKFAEEYLRLMGEKEEPSPPPKTSIISDMPDWAVIVLFAAACSGITYAILRLGAQVFCSSFSKGFQSIVPHLGGTNKEGQT